MKYLKLFEEFNPYSGKQFVDKLRIYTQASPVVKSISQNVIEDNRISFDVFTDIPGDYSSGNKTFRVTIPVNIVSKAKVETFEDGKKVFTATLEPDGENDINNILYNYIEALGLYDDSSIENLVDSYRDINTVSDIKKIIKQMG